jgi:hypothetical protein
MHQVSFVVTFFLREVMFLFGGLVFIYVPWFREMCEYALSMLDMQMAGIVRL